MIKTKNGKVKVNGKRMTIMADLASIVNALSLTLDKEEIMCAVNLGLKTPEELDEELEAIVSRLEGFFIK